MTEPSYADRLIAWMLRRAVEHADRGCYCWDCAPIRAELLMMGVPVPELVVRPPTELIRG